MKHARDCCRDFRSCRLQRLPGIGPTRAARIQAILELGKRYTVAPGEDRPQIRTPSDVANLLMVEMGLLEKEELRVILLDTKNYVKRMETIYRSWSKKLPNTTYTHMVILRDSERLLLAIDARGAALIEVEHRDQRRDLRDDAQTELAGRLLAYLRDHTDLPVLPAWAELLWRQTESDWNLADQLYSGRLI